MGKLGRIWNIIVGLTIIFWSICMMLDPDDGYTLAIVILGMYLLISGLRQLFYFFSMGIHMVGGKTILYRALIYLDLGAFALDVSNKGLQYIMIFLLIYYIFNGAIYILRAMESRKLKAGSWRGKLLRGVLNLAVAVICIININSVKIMLYVLCTAFIISALVRIWNACRRTAIVYIQ